MMKRSDIRNAYDLTNPTPDQKDKMLASIMAKAPRERNRAGKYQSQPSRTSRLAWIPAVAALFVVIFIGIFVLGRTPQAENPALENPTIEIPIAENTEIPAVYSTIIADCCTAIEDGWDEETCNSSNISARFASSREYAAANAGYQILDIDGNGMLELLIGHDNYIWNLYTLGGDDIAVQLINDNNDGTVYHLHEGGHIVEELTTKEEGYHHCFTLEGISLKMEISIYSADNDYRNMLTGQNISSAEAFDLIYKYDCLDLQLSYFFNLPDYLWEGSETLEHYLPVIEKYKTALLENWTWEQCDQADISRQIMYDTTIKHDLGWCFQDLDGNGVEELIVSDGVHLFDLYTLMPTDGSPGHILSGNSYNYTLCKDGTIERRISNGDFSYWTWLRFSGIDCVEEQKLTLDNTIHRYYLGVDKENAKTITENEAGEYLVNDEKAAMELHLTPFVEMEAQTIHEPNYYYEPIIETYRKAVVESWNPGKCMENGLSLMIGYYGELYDKLGHTQMDLNGDGNAELVITDGTNIFDLYTVIHDETEGAVRLIDATERNVYYLADGNTIYNRASGGAAYTQHNFYVVGERSLVLSQSVVFDAAEDPGNPWFQRFGEDKLVSIKEDEARDIIDSMAPIVIPFIPFGDGGLAAASEASEWEQAKEAAFDIIRNGEKFGYGEYITWLIPWREQEFENPRPLYYYLHDCNNDGIADLVLGYEDEVTAVWSYVYDDKAREKHLTLLDLSDQQWSELDESWPSWDIRRIENFLRNE